MDVQERFLRYAAIDTQSDESTGTHPSTEKQFELAHLLERELRELGFSQITLSEHCYLTAVLPATPGLENAPALGLIAHLDTAAEASGKQVSPRVVHYTGGIVGLGHGKSLDPAVFPELETLKGTHLIVTDGSTLLGGDDKAGIAAIMSACAALQAGALPHGKLCIGFTPDEEIGEGTRFFDLASFGADYAFTVDGGPAGEICFQNFNAARAIFVIHGVSVHPGSAFGTMCNAQNVAHEIAAAFPADEVPEKSCGMQGFFHRYESSGTVGEAHLSYLIRDFDETAFREKKAFCCALAERFNRQYGPGTVELDLRDQYRNMEPVIRSVPWLLEAAERAIRAAGVEPHSPPIRGGTDGAMLSFAGLPCPNLGTGDRAPHGEHEFVVLEELEKNVEILLALIREFSSASKPEGTHGRV